MNRMKILPAICLLVLLSGEVLAQVKRDPDNEKYKIARQYEAIGEIEHALGIYLDLLNRHAKNMTYFEAVSRCYTNLKRYDELIALLENRTGREPGNPQYRIKLGEAYLQMEDKERAFEIWSSLLDQHAKNVSVYRMVANSLVRARHYDKAIEIYLRGRQALDKDQLFALELAQLHTYRFNYDHATDEYLLYLRGNPKQLSYVQARIASFKGTHETYEQVTTVVKDWIDREPNNLVFRKLMISFLLSYENYDDSFDEVKKLERLKERADSQEPPGLELFKFSQITAAEEQYKLAEKALRDLIKDYPDYADRPRIEYELGRMLSMQGKHGDALKSFREVLRNYAETTWAVEATLSIGDIYLFEIFEPDSAAKNYQRVLDDFPTSKGYVDALIRLGDVLVARGSLEDAEPLYLKAVHLPAKDRRKANEISFEGYLKLSELSFFRLDFDKTRKYLQEILESRPGRLGNEFVNDALELYLLLERNEKSHRKALEQFAKARLLERQHHYDQAAEAYFELAETEPTAKLAPQSRFQYATMKKEADDFLAAVYGYQHILNEYPQHSLCDLALWEIGLIYETELNDPAKAIENYESILVSYPSSILVENARKKIRDLEGRP